MVFIVIILIWKNKIINYNFEEVNINFKFRFGEKFENKCRLGKTDFIIINLDFQNNI